MTACSVIQLNEGRRNKAIVATVTYNAGNGDKLKSDIKRIQLVQRANQVLNQYSSYGMEYPTDLEEFFGNVLEGLCNEQLTILYARDYLSQLKAGKIDPDTGIWNGDKNYNIYSAVSDKKLYDTAYDDSGAFGKSSLLSYAEFDKVIQNTNAQYQSLFDSYYDVVKAEQKAIDDKLAADADDGEEEEEEETGALTPRPVKVDTADADAEFDYLSMVKDGAREALTKRFTDDIDASIGVTENSDAKDIGMRRDAWKRAQKALTDNFKGYDWDKGEIYEYFLNSALESMVLYEFKRALTASGNNIVTDADIDAYIEKTVGQNKDAYKKASDFYSAMGSAYEGILFAPNQVAPNQAVNGKGYFYVKNIVLGFGENTKTIVSGLSEQFAAGGKTAYENEIYIELLKTLTKGIYINISNIFYDPGDGTALYYTPEKFFNDEFGADEADEVAKYLKSIKEDIISRAIKAANPEITDDELKAQVAKKLEAVDKKTENAARLRAIEEKFNDGDYKYVFKIAAADAMAFKAGTLDESKAYVVEGAGVELVLSLYKAYMAEAESNTEAASELEHTKALLEAYDVWFFSVNDDGESSFSSTVNYLIYDEANFVATFKELGFKLAGADGRGGVLTNGSAVGNYYTNDGEYYTVSEYGIHIMMVTYVPFENVSDATDANGTVIGKKLDGGQILDYYKAGDNTVRDYAKKIIQEANDNTLYNITQRNIVDLKNNGGASYETFPKKYKDLVKN
jgi:hypothetical protein